MTAVISLEDNRGADIRHDAQRADRALEERTPVNMFVEADEGAAALAVCLGRKPEADADRSREAAGGAATRATKSNASV